MTGARLLSLSWSLDPSVLGGVLMLATAYLAWRRGRPGWRGVAFGAGLVVLALALESPLHSLGERYLFSAHMAQHLLLLLVVPPLLLWGLPAADTRRLLRQRRVARVEAVLGAPAVAFGTATAALWVWHLPALYDAALRHHALHVAEHLVFLVTATMFWWPLLHPDPRRRLAAGSGMAYLAAALVSGSLLGILLTFAPAGTYPFYLDPPDPWHALALLRGTWGLTPTVDQQLGGILMWVPGGAVYIAGILTLFGRWMGGADERPEARHSDREALAPRRDATVAPRHAERGPARGPKGPTRPPEGATPGTLEGAP